MDFASRKRDPFPQYESTVMIEGNSQRANLSQGLRGGSRIELTFIVSRRNTWTLLGVWPFRSIAVRRLIQRLRCDGIRRRERNTRRSSPFELIAIVEGLIGVTLFLHVALVSNERRKWAKDLSLSVVALDIGVAYDAKRDRSWWACCMIYAGNEIKETPRRCPPLSRE